MPALVNERRDEILGAAIEQQRLRDLPVFVGNDCNLGKNVFVDSEVHIGSGVKIQNNVSVYHGVTIEDDVFVGPSAVFTNDRYPRAFSSDWEVVPTFVRKGASIGANATLVCGIEVGEYAVVAAGSVVTKDVPPFALAGGNPARVLRSQSSALPVET